ncbi:unnamed protein product [Cochlearia groenlandica]
MGRTGITKAPKLLLRSWNQIFQGRATISNKASSKPNKMIIVDYSKNTYDDDHIHSDVIFGGSEVDSSVNWVPHPRTGIFFPPGQEAVMADIPDGAASFDMTFWIRNVDGVDKPDPDLHNY